MTIDPIVDPDLPLLRKQFAELSSFQTFTLDAHQFSDGLHLLQIWQLWQEMRPENSSRLHIISKENKPLSAQEVAQKLLKFPDLSNFATRLLAQYPPAISGVHRLIFYDERLTIDLWFGDVLKDLNIK
ncbi:MAG: hypothetical protein H7Z73_02770, partial [Candidatus Saccharibacteria bacterium]|nr:hypothetical protein [Moraxellaceae bacterium]